MEIKEPVYQVEVREYDRFSGMKVEETKTYTDKKEADEFVKTFNARNTEKTVPDWYMVAYPLYA